MIYFAQKAFIVLEGKLLVVQKSKDDLNQPLKWEVPGGKMEEGESVEAHIKREVKEEVGIDIIPGRPFYIWQWKFNKVYKGESLIKSDTIVAVARFCSTNTTQTNDSGRVEGECLGETKWISIDQVKNLDWIANMIPVVESFLVEYDSMQKQ